jgi:hypothetical protein
MKRLNGTICAYCGEKATTRDHVPPKGLFLKPLPTDLVTVPSCSRCNHGASGDDRTFRNHLSIRVGGFRTTGPARRLWVEKGMPSIRKNRADLRQIAISARPVACYSPGGIYLGQGVAVPFDKAAHDRVVTRIVRGLYWHHYGIPVCAGTSVGVVFIDTTKPGWLNRLAPVLNMLTHQSIGGGVFKYAHGRATDDPLSSIWMLDFHEGRHVVCVHTGAPDEGVGIFK